MATEDSLLKELREIKMILTDLHHHAADFLDADEDALKELLEDKKRNV